ncbi:MAG: outer rane assembly protein [Chitinophagaceae bacterium]|nr:outer rane assembly protein [Chitinophagaceae bacterium]
MKKALYIVGGIVAFLLLSIFIVPLLFKNQIRVKVEQEIDKRVDALVTFDHVGVSMFRHFPNLTLSLHDLIVQGKGRFSGDTLTSIKEFAVEVNLGSLISGKETEVQSIHLVQPNIDVVVLADGLANYDIFISDTAAAPVDSSSTPVNIALDKIIISDGQIRYDDRGSHTYVNMNDLDYTGQGDFEKEIFDLATKMEIGQLTMDYGRVRYLSEKHVAIDLILEMNQKENKFTIKENEMQISHFKFGMKGYFAMLDHGYDMDLKFATEETAFKNILSLVPGIYMEDFEQIQTSGELAFSGFMKGVYDDSLQRIPAFHMDLNVKDGMFKIDTLPAAVNNIQLELLLDNPYGIMDSTYINLKTFHMNMGKHPIHGRAEVMGLTNPRVDIDVFADLELAELEKMYPLKGLALKGKLDFELKAKGVYRTKDSILAQEIPAFHLNMKLSDGKLKYDSLPTAIEDIQLHLLADNNDGKMENTIFDFKSIHFNMGKNPVHGFVRVEGYERYKIDADLKASLDLADIEKMYPIKGLVLKGLFALDVKANGIYDQAKKKLPVIDAKMNLTNGFLQSDSYPEPIQQIHLTAEAMNSTGNVADTRLNIEKFTYILEDEPFEVKGSITNMDTYAYDLKIKGKVDLEKITKIYPVPGYQLSGIIDSDIESRGTIADLEAGKYDKIFSDGNIEMKHVKVKGDDIPQRIHIKDAYFTFTPAKIIMERFEGHFGKSHVTMTGDLTNYMSFINTNSTNKMVTADMKVTCDTLDLNEWLADNVSTPTNKTATTAADTSVHPQIGVWEVPKNLDFTFDSDIKVVKYEDMFITKMDGEIRIKDGVLSMTETGFNTLNALFSVSGDYDTRNLAHPLFDFKLNIKELDINKAYRELKLVRDLAPAAADAYGIFSVDYAIKGELDQNMSPKTQTLVGGGEVRIAEAKIDGMKMFEEISKASKKQELNDPHLKDVVIDTEIRDNKLYVKPFSMNISGFDMDIEGVNNISGAINYVVKIELFPIDKLKIPCHVTGTYDNPKVLLGKGKGTE